MRTAGRHSSLRHPPAPRVPLIASGPASASALFLRSRSGLLYLWARVFTSARVGNFRFHWLYTADATGRWTCGSGRRRFTCVEEKRHRFYAGPSLTHCSFNLRPLWSQSLLPRRKHAPATGDRGRVVERDRLRDFNLVTDVRLELEEPALEIRAVVG
eukprot:scaffold45791_cov86-Phaeocystis_antarctica.AAC.2